MKKTIMNFIIISLVALLCACGKGLNNTVIKQYLENKYNQKFSYIGEGDSVWSSKKVSKVFSDNNNNELIVRFFDNDESSLEDNYYSVVYDYDFSKLIQNRFTGEYKVFVNTKSVFTSKKYNNLNEYLTNAVVIRITIYTSSSDYNVDTIKEKIKQIAVDNNLTNYISISIYQISNEDFDKLDSSTQIPKYYYSYNFYIDNGILSE